VGTTRTTWGKKLLPAAGAVLLIAAVSLLAPALHRASPQPLPDAAAPAAEEARPAAVDEDPGGAGVLELPAHARWESFTVRDGLPSDEVFAVRIDGGRVWAGTRMGLALYEGGRWRSWGVADGLPNPVVLALDVSPRTGDLWVATMAGLARFSGGRFDVFTQTNSGLSNDFVHSVKCDPDEDIIWISTAMGMSRLDLRTGGWTTFDHTNTPMHEPWTYAVGVGGGSVWVGAWGGGVLEYTKASGRWREYRDPDHEFEIDLFPDDGPVNDVTSGVDFAAGILWQAAYTGLARYDGREWRSYFSEDSGLAGNFVNFVRAQGRFAWLATDQGVSLTDGDGWITYRRLPDGRGETILSEGARRIERRVGREAIAHDYVLGVDAAGDDVWLATGGGVSHGVREGAPAAKSPRSAALMGRGADSEPEALDAAARPARAPGSPADRFHYAATPDLLQPYRGMVPYKDIFTERSQFRGTGREAPDPPGLTEVRVGFIGPLEDQDHPRVPPGFRSAVKNSPKAVYGRRMLKAATMAVEEANVRGGYKGIPFAVVPRTDLVLWGQTSNELVRFVQEDGVWAVEAGIDSNHNHVLSRGALKVEVPILSAGSTDPTLVEHSIPWLVRAIDDDRQLGYALLNEIVFVRKLGKIAILRANDRDGRTGVLEFVDAARRLGHPILIEQRFYEGDRDFKNQVERIRETSPDAIVLWGNPEETGAAVRQIREMGLTASIFGFDRMTQETFLKLAGGAAEGVVVAASMNPRSADPLWTGFRERYIARWGEEPDSFAAHAYDGMNLIVDAIRKAGINRARIRDALFDLRTYHGAAGEIVFDTNMSNIARPWIAVVEGGRFRFEPAPPWPPESGHAARDTASPAGAAAAARAAD
jgi:branched-chain amino acid transport system substrate-binding protein